MYRGPTPVKTVLGGAVVLLFLWGVWAVIIGDIIS